MQAAAVAPSHTPLAAVRLAALPPALAQRCLLLAGPTAAGKTAAALAIAACTPVEIISVDSALVYRGMDIGTAKPSQAERAQVPHHLIDLRDPLQPYSAAAFAADARGLIDAILARGRTPLLVGGTMLYFKALLEGLDPLPRANAALRAALQVRAERDGWPALHAELARVDPATAARLAPQDAQRIGRALEVWQLTGQPISAFHKTLDTLQDTSENIAAQAANAWASRLISLETEARSTLHERIAQRFDAMLASGFLEEVAALRARGDLHPDLPAMRCVGYRQAWQALDAGLHGAALHQHVRETGVAATRQLAKRQITWLRSLPQRRVVFNTPLALAQAQTLLQSSA
ncbi:MAG: tRNA (adenosine(37)-N6)-dimethylallyltransferase MiaA [Burkholderiaceae bacterium]